MEILRMRAEELDKEGYVSMLPYFEGCKRSPKSARLFRKKRLGEAGLFGIF